MAVFQVYTFTELVGQIATAVQGSASALYNFTVGSTLRAIAEATSAVVLWLQALILQLLTVTRAATSVGSDLDTFMADFNLPREEAVAASGQVTFARFTSTIQALVPIGATVQTADGTEAFTVIVDTTNSAYSASQNGYVLATSEDSINVPVQAQTPGSGGNVQAGTIRVITTPIPSVDTVSNAAPYANGLDAEADAAFRTRFVLYLASLSKGTYAAIAYAISTVQQGLDYTLTANKNYDGSTNNGFFYAVISDGTATPPSGLLTRVYSAVDAIRGFTIRFAVFAPVAETANVSMTITSAPGFDHPTVVGAVGTAVTAFINALKLGVTLPYTQLAAIAYGVQGVANVSAVLLNSGTADLVATDQQLIRAGTVTVA